MPQIENILTISTAHLSREDARILEKHPMFFNAYPKYEDSDLVGWIIDTCEYRYDQAFLGDSPGSIRSIIEAALEMNVQWINIDRDGDTIDELPAYEW